MPEVLLVEDDAVIVRVLEINLRAAGFEVRSTSTGAGAIAALRDGRPDCIVCDLGLPDVTGAPLVVSLREGAADVPIVVVTGEDPAAARDGGYAPMVEATLRKPVDPVDVVEAVRHAIRRDPEREDA